MATDSENLVCQDSISHHATNQLVIESSKASSVTEAPPGSEEPQWLQGLPLLMIMTAITLVCYLMLLDVSIVSTALPAITNEFKSLPDMGWYGAAYQLSNAALQPLTGKIYASFTPKWTWLCFFAVFEIGSLICALATSSKMLIVGRAVAGMGNSGIQNGCVTIIAGIVPLSRRPALLGVAMGISQLGLASGPLVGGALTEYTTWRWCFWINLPVGAVIAALFIFTRVPDPTPKEPPTAVLRTLHNKLDFVGFVLFAGAVIMLLLAVQYGGHQFPWGSSTVIGLFCGSGINFIAWLIWDWKKGDDALIPLPLLRQRAVWSSCATYAVSMGSLFTTSYFLPIYFQGVLGASPLISGLQLLPNIVPQLLMAVLSGALVTRLGYYLPFSLMGSILASIAAGLISTYSLTTPLQRRIGYQILLGAGHGLGLQMPMIALQSSVQPQQIPVSVAVLMFGPQLAGALLVSFGNTILTNSLVTLIPQYAPDVDPAIVVTAGATSFRNEISPSDLTNVLVAYSKSVSRVFYLGAACGAVSFVTAWGMGWKDIRAGSRPPKPSESGSQVEEKP
ncbi:major facilitator superfamily domain-containing protein [Aspergillus taichungensis]|uniref:Major facilitator superfamily domain-containing protein n=1 Tax=Aspergillus taichungensis TaxID=482145 RepID=A0A2J5HQN2_9EURO|nr:major facilitator superfamily domain-containing protein [Aspergillus taichungensis]